MKQPVKAAAYMRLSQDDERQGESQSIETHWMIFSQYVREFNGSHYEISK